MARHNYGEPYDPALRQTEHGTKLYNAWRHMRRYPHCEEWNHFPTFYEWAMQNGYKLGAWLSKIDDDKPFEEKNCVWYFLSDEKRVADWNRAVNRIRKHYGMPPLEGTKYGD